jgi:SAM-dependent methyltransferase
VTLTAQPQQPEYSFDNDDPEAHDRHRYLSTMLDDFTFARLSTLGDLTGRRCLEVGAGGGSVARWLAERVGPTGEVVATDFNTKHLPPDAGYTVVRNDLTVDPLPAGEWDVIHARLVLMHIPQRREILARLAAALAPGGALVLEDWQTAFGELVLAAPNPRAAELVDDYQTTLVERILPANGTDSRWAQRVPAAMLAEGLVDVQTEVEARSWPGGTEGALLVAANIGQLRDRFLQAGFSGRRLDELCRLVADPRLVLRGNFTYSTIGFRPAVPPGADR